MIDSDIIESYLNCKYKAYLKLNYIKEEKNEFSFFDEQQSVFKTYFKSTINKQQLINAKSLTEDLNFSKCSKYINNFKYKSDTYSIQFDALEIIITNKSVPEFVPILITASETITNIQKLLLVIKSLLVAKDKNYKFNYGKILYGKHLNTYKFKLSNFFEEAERIIKEIFLLKENSPQQCLNRHCGVCGYNKRCRAELTQKDDLSLLSNMPLKEILKYKKRGIFTVTQFAYTFRARKKFIKGKLYRALKAKAINDNKIYFLSSPELPKSETYIFIDFEGLPDENFIYLISVILKNTSGTQQFSFWADSADEEEIIFNRLFDAIKNANETKEMTIYHYGNYEIQNLKRFNKKHSGRYDNEICFIVKKSCDLLKYFFDIYLPTYSNSLKSIAGFLGFKWSDDSSIGLNSILWRKKWEILKDDYWKAKLITYNVEDCEAIRCIKDWLEEINHDRKELSHVDTIKNIRFGKQYKKFVSTNEDFNIINSRGYFDYQQNKIYLKTDVNIKKRNCSKRRTQKKLKPNTIIITPPPEKCSRCGNSKLYCMRRRSENNLKLVDLKFFEKGVKRWITEYEAIYYLCPVCKKEVRPNKGLPRYGHNLKSWIINQYISYRASIEQISIMANEIFGINIPDTSILDIKRSMAQNYLLTYEEIERQIFSGSLVHADETGVDVRGFNNSYVWVFANLDTVIYMFKPNRETEFLKEIFKTFRGVLVSDFYTGYDGIECPKQKCLIHLMRDLNEDLLKNQFDDEFKNLVVEFGRLLRRIINTIDKFGLKKRHLNKHLKDVDFFYASVLSKNYISDLVKAYVKRFMKYKTSLFCFLLHNGIPWNNNNAEHAIKPFAIYRKKGDGSFTEKSLQDYLILLSIQQTCRNRKISFLDFLKSGKKTIG